jgi:glutamyl-tRNA(Gln) amidotransferase subunit E
LNKKLAEQIFDSSYLDIFEEIAGSTKIQTTFIASKLTEDLVNLERQGQEVTVLTDDVIRDIFNRLDMGIIAKESIVLIFEKLMKKEAKTVDEAIAALGISPISDQELYRAIDKILEENMSVIKVKGMESLNMLMGRSMAIFRGKVDGQKINSILKKKLKSLLMSLTTTK